MDQLETIKGPMLDAVLSPFDLFLAGVEAARTSLNSKTRDALWSEDESRFDSLLVCGMGGSAFPADIYGSLMGEVSDFPITVWRDYELPPRQASTNTLVVIVSFSGNTAETISAFKRSIQLGLEVAVLTTGGQLAALAAETSAHLIRLTPPVFGAHSRRSLPDLQPRASTPMFLGALSESAKLLKLFDGAGNVAETLERAYYGLRDQVGDPDGHDTLASTLADAQSLALWLEDRSPIVVSAPGHRDSVARVAKIKFNENAKRPSFFHAVPEFNHNEMIGFTEHRDRFAVIVLDDETADRRHRIRLATTAETLVTAGLKVRLVMMRGTDRSEKTINTLQLFDFTSLFVAQLAGIDPNPVPMVEQFKTALRSALPGA